MVLSPHYDTIKHIELESQCKYSENFPKLTKLFVML